MIKIEKRSLSVFLALTLVVSMAMAGSISTFATVAENHVFSETITAEQGQRISVPVKIENNTGFMGFVVLVDTDRDVLRPVNAKKGAMLTGAFEDSIDVTFSGAFRVIYSGTEDINQDGTLFTLEFDVDPEAIGDTSILLSYSKADTFNEKYQEVTFNCESASVTVAESTTEPPIDPPVNIKLSDRIRAWWNNLSKFWHYITAVVVVPLVFIISIFEK